MSFATQPMHEREHSLWVAVGAGRYRVRRGRAMLRGALAALLGTVALAGPAMQPLFDAGAVRAQTAAELARGKDLVEESCFLCHGMQGESTSELFPRLSGQHAEYIARQLENFKNGKRQSTQMTEMVKDLTLADMRALGAYFQAQAPQPQQPEDMDLAAVGKYLFLKGNKFSGVPACAACHGATASGTAELPRLAGQFSGYIQTQLKAYKSRARDHPVMYPIAARLTELEIAALSEYLHGK